MTKLKLQSVTDKLVTAGHIGSVANVISGDVPEIFSHHYYDAEDIQYGFELASPQSIQSLGEAVVVNGYCYANSTDKADANYYQTISGKTFLTTGLFLIPKNTKPNFYLEQSFNSAIGLNTLYKMLYQELQKPFAFSGFFEFELLHATAIAKAPVYQENIFEYKDAYYSIKRLSLSNQCAFLVGVVADFHDKNEKIVLKELESVLYKNPFDKQPGLTSHAHCITFQKSIQQTKAITPNKVDKTLHVFADKSLIKSVQGEIFSIAFLKDFT